MSAVLCVVFALLPLCVGDHRNMSCCAVGKIVLLSSPFALLFSGAVLCRAGAVFPCLKKRYLLPLCMSPR